MRVFASEKCLDLGEIVSLKALQHTPYTAMKFRTFSLKGEEKLQEFLADLGIPLNQVRIT